MATRDVFSEDELSEKLLGITVGALRGYGACEQTRTDHLREVAGYLGWRTVDEPCWKDLEEFLFARAMELDSAKLLRQACEYLSSSMLVRPGIVKILERVAAARERAREETWARVPPAGRARSRRGRTGRRCWTTSCESCGIRRSATTRWARGCAGTSGTLPEPSCRPAGARGGRVAYRSVSHRSWPQTSVIALVRRGSGR